MHLYHIQNYIKLSLIYRNLNAPTAIADILSYKLIKNLHKRIEKILRLGKISYSLYLTNPLILIRSEGIKRRIPEGLLDRSFIFKIITTIEIFIARIYWRYIEIPSQSLSKKWFPHKETR